MTAVTQGGKRISVFSANVLKPKISRRLRYISFQQSAVSGQSLTTALAESCSLTADCFLLETAEALGQEGLGTGAADVGKVAECLRVIGVQGENLAELEGCLREPLLAVER